MDEMTAASVLACTVNRVSTPGTDNAAGLGLFLGFLGPGVGFGTFRVVRSTLLPRFLCRGLPGVRPRCLLLPSIVDGDLLKLLSEVGTYVARRHHYFYYLVSLGYEKDNQG